VMPDACWGHGRPRRYRNSSNGTRLVPPCCPKVGGSNRGSPTKSALALAPRPIQ
jgi:hypothetical protein